MRVTNVMLFRMALADINDIAEENSVLLRQTGTGRRLSRPSDDPTDSVRQLRIRRDIAGQNQIISAIGTAQDELTSSELGIDNAISIFQRAKELGISAATSARADSDFEAIATEAGQLLADLVGIANRQISGRYLYAGTNTLSAPFVTTGDPVTAVTYVGNSDARTLTIAPGVELPMNVPGDRAFLTGNTFQALIDLRDAAANHDVEALANSVTQGLDTALESLINVRTQIGAVTGGLERAVDHLRAAVLDSQSLLSAVEDVDMVQALVDLQTVSTRRQAALQAAAKVIQPTLLDYLA